MEKKLDVNYTKMLRAILNKSWRQQPTKQLLYNHLLPITKTIEVSQTRNVGHCWRSKDELISDILLWTPSHGRAKTGRPARTCVHQLCAVAGCSLEDLPEAMDYREGWREKASGIRAVGATWWWWQLKFKSIILFYELLQSLNLMSRNFCVIFFRYIMEQWKKSMPFFLEKVSREKQLYQHFIRSQGFLF